MSLIGPVSFKPGALAPELGNYVTQIQRTAPAPITVNGINRDFSDIPKSGHTVTLAGVEENLAAGTLWRWLYDNRGQQNVPVTWSTKADGGALWSGVIAVVPDPTQGGQANQHGTFTITIPLASAPVFTPPVVGKTGWAVTLTGGPTGGTYTLFVNGVATAPIPYNAAAAAVAAAINAISGVTGITGVTGSGTITLTFPVSVTLAVTHVLTGGTNPGVTVA